MQDTIPSDLDNGGKSHAERMLDEEDELLRAEANDASEFATSRYTGGVTGIDVASAPSVTFVSTVTVSKVAELEIVGVIPEPAPKAAPTPATLPRFLARCVAEVTLPNELRTFEYYVATDDLEGSLAFETGPVLSTRLVEVLLLDEAPHRVLEELVQSLRR